MITAAQSALNRQRALSNARSDAKSRLLLIGQSKHIDPVLRGSLSSFASRHPDIPRHRPEVRIIGRANIALARLETLSQRTIGCIGD